MRQWMIWGCGIIAGLIWLWRENNSLTNSIVTVKNRKIPMEFSGFRIVQVSDLHNKKFGRGQRKLLKKIKALQPDLVVITGDLIYAAHLKSLRSYCPMKNAADFVKGVVNLAPTVYVPGNHEGRTERYPELLEILQRSGVRVLYEEAIPLERADERIYLIGSGTADLEQQERKGTCAVEKMIGAIRGAVDTTPESGYRILLAHHPEYFEEYCGTGAELVFAGHAHGGQIRIPGIGALFAPGQGTFPDYVSGFYKKDRTNMVVSRGLGRSLFPFRIFNRPELVCVTLMNERMKDCVD